MASDNWTTYPLPEVIDFQEGPGILARDFRDAGVPLVRLAGLDRTNQLFTGCNYLDPKMVRKRWAHFALAEGDVLVSTSASLGRTRVVGKDGAGAIAYTGIIRMRPRDDRLFAPFIQYLLEAPDFQRQADIAGAGSVIRHFGPIHLRQMTVRIPRVDVQRQIVHVLGKFDDKMELNRRMNRTLEKIAAAIFKSWFIDFDPVRAKLQGRDPNFPGEIAGLLPDTFENSDLGPIPKGWRITSVEEVAKTVRGRSYKSAELQSSDVALVTLKSFLRGGGYRVDGLKSYTGGYKPDQIVQPGEIVVAMTDVTQNAEVIGRPAIVMPDAGHSVLVASLDTSIVRPTATMVSTPFLYGLFSTEAFRAHAYAHSGGTTVLHLAKNTIPSFEFICPTEKIQKAYLSLVEPVRARQMRMHRQNRCLTGLRDALLPKLLSGEIELLATEAVVEEAS